MKIMPNHEFFLFYLSILTWLTQNTVKTIFYQELKVALTKELVYSFGIFSRLTTEVSVTFRDFFKKNCGLFRNMPKKKYDEA